MLNVGENFVRSAIDQKTPVIIKRVNNTRRVPRKPKWEIVLSVALRVSRHTSNWTKINFFFVTNRRDVKYAIYFKVEKTFLIGLREFKKKQLIRKLEE